MAFGAQGSYIVLLALYFNHLDLSALPSPLWLIIHYLIYFAFFFMVHIYIRKRVDIKAKPLPRLLKEVAETDLTGDPEA